MGALVLTSGRSDALPAGRSWSTVVDTFKIVGHTFGIQPRRMETDALGRPLAFVEALGGIGRDMYVLRWAGSTWQSVDHLGYGTKGVRPVPAPPGIIHLVWAGLEEITTDRLVSYLVMNELVGDSLTRPDTVTTINSISLTIGAGASSVRRWVAAGDFGDLRLLYSQSPGTWFEVPVDGRGDRGVALAAIDDTTALLVWRDQDLGPGAGLLRGSSWELTTPPPMNDLFDAVPRLRPRPSGGYWLSWSTERDFIGIASFRDNAWTPPESVFCAYVRPGAHRAQSRAELSNDDSEFPAVSWMAVSAVNGLTSVCVCVPTDSGFTVAENILGSEEGISPVVTRDGNQDVWVTWRAPTGMGWIHTYTRATCSTPIVASASGKRTVAWELSESAPGSWWAVLRAGEGEEFAEVVRVRAGAGSAMSWDDQSFPEGTSRYRIRRECVDTQYQWLSEVGQSPVDVAPDPSHGLGLKLLRTSANPSAVSIRFEVLNASAGPLDVRVYDVRGRQVHWQRFTASGQGQDSVLVDLTSAPTSGLYFLQVEDLSGGVSSSLKFVLLR